jgi:hypothetical protein
MPDYCQLDQAFGPIIEENTKPVTKKEKKKKDRSVPAPPLEEPFEIGNDPDRQQYVRPKLVEAMKKTKPSWFGTTDNVEPSSPLIKNGGSSAVTSGFSDFNPVDNSPKQFMLGSEFMSAFNQSGAQKASAFPAILNDESDIWGPLVPPSAHAQAPSAYYNFDHMRPGGDSDDSKSINKGALQRRLQSIYDRLDALETAKRENAHTEVMLFVLSGVFLLFSLDVVTKLSK